jgi:hypothetical protein
VVDTSFVTDRHQAKFKLGVVTCSIQHLRPTRIPSMLCTVMCIRKTARPLLAQQSVQSPINHQQNFRGNASAVGAMMLKAVEMTW